MRTEPWRVREFKVSSNVTNNMEKIIHINRLRPLLRPDIRHKHSEGQQNPSLFQYVCEDLCTSTYTSTDTPQSVQPVTTKSGHIFRLFDYYAYH